MTVQKATSSYQRPETTATPRRQPKNSGHHQARAPAHFSAISNQQQHGLMFPTHANQLW
jgi:hypothetical protein